MIERIILHHRSTPMKASFLIAMLFAAINAIAGVVSHPFRITLKEGSITPLESGTLIRDVNLKEGAKEWLSFENYENKLERCFETQDGIPLLTIKNAMGGMGDTAWNIVSKALELPAQTERILLEIECRTTVNLGIKNTSTHWCNRVIWLDENAKEIANSSFKYNGSAEGFSLTQIPLDVPAGTKSMKIQLGADNPNVVASQYIAFKSIRVLKGDSQPNHTGDSSFVSRIFKATNGKISWEGDFPEASCGSLQISWATAVNGAPGRWSEFVGPDGTTGTYYKNHAEISGIPPEANFFKYRFTLHSNKTAPVVRKIRVGDFEDGKWERTFCAEAPIIRNMTSHARDFNKAIVAKIIPSTLIDWKSIKFVIDGKDVTNALAIQGNTVSYIPDKPWTDELHTFTVSATDIEGNKNTVKRHFAFSPVPEDNIIRLRDDGFVLIDEKPFFPIGIFSMAKKPWNGFNFDKGFLDIKEAGFNLTHIYNSARDYAFNFEFLPAARKHGIKLFISGPNGANSHDMQSLLKAISNEKGNHDILSWYIADDTSEYWTSDELSELSDAIKAVDPSRITSQACGANGFDGFANGTDAFLPEIYPILEIDSESSDKCVSKVIRDVKHSFERIELEGRPNVSVWATLQYFQGWGNKRYPTQRELRAMTYAAIIHGSQGIVYYTYAPGDHVNNHGAASFPENWQTISSVTRELQSLIPVLCERKPQSQPTTTVLSGPQQDALGAPSISVLLKKHDGKSYLLSVNSSVHNVTASFHLPSHQKGNVLFENRTVVVKEGILTDIFAPYDVHIYELQ